MTIEPTQSWLRPLSPEAGKSAGPQTITIARPSFDLADIVGAVWRRKLPLAVWLALCFASAGWYLAVTPNTFAAAATVIFEPRQPIGPPTTSSQNTLAQALDVAQAESQIQVIRSERILSNVFDVLGLQDAPELAAAELGLKDRLSRMLGLVIDDIAAPGDRRARTFQAFSDRVGVRRLGQSYVVEVSYQAKSPQQAARVANAIAVQYIRSQIDVKAAAAAQGTEYLRGRIANIQAEQQAALDGVRSGRIPDMQFSDADARIIGAALLPLNKASPKVALILAFALTFGLLTGLLTIAARQALDRTLDSRRRVRETLGTECLGVLPRVVRPRDATRLGDLPLARLAVDNPGSPFVEALRSVRTATLLGLPNQRGWAIGIVSVAAGEGRSTIAVNLAHLLSAPNAIVALVDADIHNPTLTGLLAPDASEGLVELLLARNEGGASRRDQALSAQVSFVPAVGQRKTVEPNLFLGSEPMLSLLTRLRATRNVVVDLPSFSMSSDAQALSAHLDGVILVVEAGSTKIEEAADVLWTLRAGHARVLGVVLNKARTNRVRRRSM